MTTDVVIHEPQHTTLNEQWRYAQAVTTVPERGAQSLLPAAYRGNPANVLIAIGLGTAIGIAPAQALYEIYVVNGRPSPSANLLAGLVRRAGHKLRIEGDETHCTATLIRSDDPDAPFAATWTMEKAKGAGLSGKDTWKQYPAAMLRARAISEVVRMGASEVLLGMEYSAEEMRDTPQAAVEQTPRPTAEAFLETAPTINPAADVGPIMNDAVAEERADTQPADPMTAKTRGHMFALFNELGISEDDQRAGIAHIVGHPIESRGDLTETEAAAVVNRLKVKKAEQDAGADPVEPDLFVGEQA